MNKTGVEDQQFSEAVTKKRPWNRSGRGKVGWASDARGGRARGAGGKVWRRVAGQALLVLNVSKRDVPCLSVSVERLCFLRAYEPAALEIPLDVAEEEWLQIQGQGR